MSPDLMSHKSHKYPLCKGWWNIMKHLKGFRLALTYMDVFLARDFTFESCVKETASLYLINPVQLLSKHC